MKTRDVILSIKPKYWKMIKNGSKTVEWRRKWVKEGVKVNNIIVYCSAPVKRIVATLFVDYVVDNLKMLWTEYGKAGGVSKDEFDGYFDQQSYGYAIIINRFIEHDTTPEKLWTWWKRPPQNFMYVREA